MHWLVMLAALLGQSESAAIDYVPADRTDIPVAFRGHWSLDPAFCNQPGPASVRIGPRNIDFWERHGFLDLAQLNFATDPPTFHGNFRWVELSHFSSSALRLKMVRHKLSITESDDPDAPHNQVLWSHCSVD